MKAIRPLSKFFYTRKEDEITWETTQENKLYVTATYVGGNEGKVIWNLVNGTDELKLVGLVRGADLETGTVPEYLFGRAFGDVYYLLGMSTYLKDLQNIPMYTLAVYNDQTIGFVFAIPPKEVVKVPEYGFIGLKSYTARLIEVKPKKLGTYLILYNPEEYLIYYNELGQNLGVLPAVYMTSSYNVEAENLGYSFHERLVIKVPKLAIDMGRLINFLKL